MLLKPSSFTRANLAQPLLFSTACIKLLIPKHVNDLNDSANSLSAYEKLYRFAASAHRVLFQSDIIMVQLQKVCKLILNLNALNIITMVRILPVFPVTMPNQRHSLVAICMF